MRKFFAVSALALAGLGVAVPATAQDEYPPATIDTNDDGVADAWDRNGDGAPDAWDTDGDSRPDLFDDKVGSESGE